MANKDTLLWTQNNVSLFAHSRNICCRQNLCPQQMFPVCPARKQNMKKIMFRILLICSPKKHYEQQCVQIWYISWMGCQFINGYRYLCNGLWACLHKGLPLSGYTYSLSVLTNRKLLNRKLWPLLIFDLAAFSYSYRWRDTTIDASWFKLISVKTLTFFLFGYHTRVGGWVTPINDYLINKFWRSSRAVE